MGQSSPEISTFTKGAFVLLLVTAPATALGTAVVSIDDRPEIRYSVEPSTQRCEPVGNTTADPPDWGAEAQHYTDLSPDGQKIFRQARQAEDEYTTRRTPDDFAIQTDTTERNHILYDSGCFALTGQSTRNPNAAFDAVLVRMAGGALTVIFAVTTVVSFLWTATTEGE